MSVTTVLFGYQQRKRRWPRRTAAREKENEGEGGGGEGGADVSCEFGGDEPGVHCVSAVNALCARDNRGQKNSRRVG